MSGKPKLCGGSLANPRLKSNVSAYCKKATGGHESYFIPWKPFIVKEASNKCNVSFSLHGIQSLKDGLRILDHVFDDLSGTSYFVDQSHALAAPMIVPSTSASR